MKKEFTWIDRMAAIFIIEMEKNDPSLESFHSHLTKKGFDEDEFTEYENERTRVHTKIAYRKARVIYKQKMSDDEAI